MKECILMSKNIIFHLQYLDKISNNLSIKYFYVRTNNTKIHRLQIHRYTNRYTNNT
jgi:hypothetical protein